MMKLRISLLASIIALWAAWSSAAEGDLNALLDGVAKIAAPGAPGSLCVFGEGAFVVVAGEAQRAIRQPVVAAGRLGKGRVVALGHDGYFGGDALAAADTGRLMLNAVRWAAGGNAEPRIAVRRQGGLLAFLQKQGIKAEPLDGADWSQKWSGFNVLCTHPGSIARGAEADAMAEFLKQGGGLVAGDTGWGWLQLHSGKTLQRDHVGNQILAAAGLAWADGMAERTDPAGFTTKEPPSRLLNASVALDALEAHDAAKSKLSQPEIAQASWTLSQAARSLPSDDTLLLPRLRKLLERADATAIPTPQKPLTMQQPLARVVLTLQLQEVRTLPAEKVRAHPAATAFPGDVPANVERVERTLEINTSVPAWHSTGLYAPAGELLTVEVPQAVVGKGLVVRIGCHSDGLWHHSSWHRAPEICCSFPIGSPTTRVASAFGGLVYIDVPGGSKLGTVAVKVRGAIEAPYFVLGKTDLASWREKIRLRPAPWAELATSKVILSLPSEAVRKLEDPEDLMKFWDRVLDACAELAGRPLERERPERYVTDVQISAGYMHSGYPIMTFLDMPPVMVDKQRMMANAHGGVWGLFHELGHNHQSGDWTFGGTGEVTVNLFTMYVFDKVCGMPLPKQRGELFGPNRAKMIKAYLATGPDFAKWQQDPFLALLMYIQLQEAFGWDPFKKVFAEYRALPGGQRPRNDNDKRDQWMARLSRTVGRNLGPFFHAWGVPTSDKARASLADLPSWMPDGFPPK